MLTVWSLDFTTRPQIKIKMRIKKKPASIPATDKHIFTAKEMWQQVWSRPSPTSHPDSPSAPLWSSWQKEWGKENNTSYLQKFCLRMGPLLVQPKPSGFKSHGTKRPKVFIFWGVAEESIKEGRESGAEVKHPRVNHIGVLRALRRLSVVIDAAYGEQNIYLSSGRKESTFPSCEHSQTLNPASSKSQWDCRRTPRDPPAACSQDVDRWDREESLSWTAALLTK